ncbi:MAG: magnesium transporter, partial [Muribaculaceae bacterium]|nr:magnesium transporter [Muribaculaceae bacterium]
VLLYNLIWPADDNVQKAQITTMAVTISLFGVVLFASVFGTFVPIMLERLKIDPAIATGPFVTVTNDIVGMIIYMVVSSSLIDIFLG